MMNNNRRTMYAASIGLVASAAVVGFILVTPPAPPRQMTRGDANPVAPEPQQVQATPPAVVTAPPVADNVPPPLAIPDSNLDSVAAPHPPAGRTPVLPPGRPPKSKPDLQDPVARAALSLVGADPEAEAYWLEAIYDPSLPNEEREDLMEDLNEDGLSDPKRPGAQDLPLILNRLVIIEELAPWADDFMWPHLREAYKDLLNLAEITQGGGEPVR
jgi:hypothetical protein